MPRGKRNRHRGVTRRRDELKEAVDAFNGQGDQREANPLECGAEGCPSIGFYEVQIPGVGLVRLCHYHREVAKVDQIRAERLSERHQLENPDDA